jgi:hypothetical protein
MHYDGDFAFQGGTDSDGGGNSANTGVHVLLFSFFTAFHEHKSMNPTDTNKKSNIL